MTSKDFKVVAQILVTCLKQIHKLQYHLYVNQIKHIACKELHKTNRYFDEDIFNKYFDKLMSQEDNEIES